MIIYVTGKSGAGKSTFARALANTLKYKYIDVDTIGHKVYEYPEITKKAYSLFGNAINDENGKFNRKKLGQIVFSSRHSPEVKEFSDLTWKYMKAILSEELTDNSVVDWILLPHTSFWSKNALRILVKPQNEDVRIEKLMQRDNIPEEYVKLRDTASICYDEKEFDFVFTNDYDENQMLANIQTVTNFLSSATVLTVLGTLSPYAKPGHACPSFLLTHKGDKLLLDCGSGSHRFFDMSSLNNLAIAISHLHRDHYNDIFNYMYSAYVLKNQGKLFSPLQVFLPGLPEDKFNDIANESLTYSICNTISQGKIYEFGDFKFQFLEIIHSSDVLSYAIKVTVSGKTIIYTGDCSYKSKDALISFAKDADSLICESSFLESYNFPKECNHLTALQAAEIAKLANVKKLILTHFWPEEDTLNYYKEAKTVFLNVFIAKENEKYFI